MCDYSLHHVASTPAKVGDKLVSTGFARSSTRGFCLAEQPNVAACLSPGTELAFEKDIECERGMGFLPRRRHQARVARFRQINMHQPYSHHDALELPNGQIILVTNLCPGQRATVLQLPATAQPAAAERAAPETPAPSPSTPIATL